MKHHFNSSTVLEPVTLSLSMHRSSLMHEAESINRISIESGMSILSVFYSHTLPLLRDWDHGHNTQ
jgi:hypothetical protein